MSDVRKELKRFWNIPWAPSQTQRCVNIVLKRTKWFPRKKTGGKLAYIQYTKHIALPLNFDFFYSFCYENIVDIFRRRVKNDHAGTNVVYNHLLFRLFLGFCPLINVRLSPRAEFLVVARCVKSYSSKCLDLESLWCFNVNWRQLFWLNLPNPAQRMSAVHFKNDSIYTVYNEQR